MLPRVGALTSPVERRPEHDVKVLNLYGCRSILMSPKGRKATESFDFVAKWR